MNKLITANAKLLLICVVVQLVYASPAEAQSSNSLNLGSEDHVVYIDITKLPTKIKFENDDIMPYDSKRSAASFYHKLGWGLDNCPAGNLREGVVAYCLPCVGLGRHQSDPHHQEPDRFVGIGPIGIVVWYEPATDRFYLWNAHWNFPNALGPFVGNPKLALNHAIKPRKGQRNFPGMTLSVLSQRWLYPDERQARVSPGSVSSDCSMNGPCVRDVEQQNLNTFITRFRLVNNTGRRMYYLGDLNNDDPIGYRVPESVRRTDCNNKVERNLIEWRRKKWKPLLPGSSVEFEVHERGWHLNKQFFGVLVNTEPTYWDEVEVLGEYTSMFRTFKYQPEIVR